jgi:hypothetical protein
VKPTPKVLYAFGVDREVTAFARNTRQRLDNAPSHDGAASVGQTSLAQLIDRQPDEAGWVGDDSIQHSLSDEDSCWRCGYADNTAQLLQCVYCMHWIHVKCFNDYHEREETGRASLGKPEDAGERFCCRSIDECRKIYENAYKAGFVNNDMGLLPDEPVEHPNENSASEELEFEPGLFEPNNASLTYLERAVRKLSDLETRNANTFTAVRLCATQGITLGGSHWRSFMRSCETELAKAGVALTDSQKSVIESTAPPQDIRRAAQALLKGCINEKELAIKYERQGVEVLSKFSYVDPTEAAASLYLSRGNVGYMPPESVQRCSTGRLPDCSRAGFYAEHMKFAGKQGHIPLEIGLYSDASHSASGNVEFTPLWLFLPGQEPSYRFVQKERAHALVAILPDSKAVTVRYINGDRRSTDAARAELTSQQLEAAADELRKQALETVFLKLAEKEQCGLRIIHEAYAYTLHPLVSYYVCDMKERRSLLPLRRAGATWDCTHCYSFPGQDRPSEIGHGLRSLSTDALIRERFTTNYRAEPGISKAKQFDKDYGHLGVALQDDSPFTRMNKSKEALFWTLNGPYEVCLVDALHCKDGIVRYIFDWVRRFIGADFISQTQRFGNFCLETGAFHFHVMEKGLLSFHSAPLAVMLGTFKNENLTNQDRIFLFDGLCDLLEVLNLMTDPCPSYVEPMLRSAIASFEKFARTLAHRLREERKENVSITTKMHELFAHAADHSAVGGVFSAFSSKLLECFMQNLKRSFERTSRQREDGSAYRGMLEQDLLEHAVDEHERSKRCDVHHSRKDTCEPRFRVANHAPLLKFHELLESNVDNAGAAIFNLDPTDARIERAKAYGQQKPDNGAFGSSLVMQVFNTSTLAFESQTVKAVVPGVLKGDVSHFGGFFNAIAFMPPAEGDNILKETLDETPGPFQCWDAQYCTHPGCTSRHHDPSFQLLCSAARRTEDCHGIPLLFTSEFVLVWALKECDQVRRTLPYHAALKEMECDFRIEIVPLNRIKGTCLLRPWSSQIEKKGPQRCFVFPGRGSFGHDILQ